HDERHAAVEDVRAADDRGHQCPEDHGAEADVGEVLAGRNARLNAAEEGAEAENVHHRRRDQPEDAEARLARAHDDVQPARQGPERREAEGLARCAPERAGHAVTARPGADRAFQHAFAHDSAASRSARRSASDSIPTLSRTRSSPMPRRARFSAGTLAWVMTAGWLTRLSTPPSDSARVNSCVRSQNRFAASKPPLTRIETMPPKPSIWRFASAWCGCDSRPG